MREAGSWCVVWLQWQDYPSCPSRRGLVPVVVMTVCAVVFGPVGSAHASTVVALWNMNEAAGSTVLVDSSANHINGTTKQYHADSAVHSFQYRASRTVRCLTLRHRMSSTSGEPIAHSTSLSR